MTRTQIISTRLTGALCIMLLATALGCSATGDGQGLPPTLALVAPELAPASAGVVMVDIEARVTAVTDPGSFLGGGIGVGDAVTGLCHYDEQAVDSKADPKTGKYVFRSAPYGINLQIAGLFFYSDPSSVDMTIHVRNDRTQGKPPGPKDLFDAQSKSNLDVLPGVGVRTIKIDLKDYTATAISSDALLGLAVDIDDWGSASVVTFKGVDGWTVNADITSMLRRDPPETPDDPARDPLHFHEQ